MSARTDTLVSQAETGKIILRPSSPLRPVVTRRVPVNNGGLSVWFRCLNLKGKTTLSHINSRANAND
jgi:hypothetical protein